MIAPFATRCRVRGNEDNEHAASCDPLESACLESEFGAAGACAWTLCAEPKQDASYQVKELIFQNLASRNYRVLLLC